MSSKKKFVPIPKSVDDPFYRYCREILEVNYTKRNIELPNIDKVAKALERDVNEVCQFIKLKINRQIKINTVDDRLIVTIPNFDTKELDINIDDIVEEYINKYVVCPDCKIPETVYKIREKSVKIECKACGKLNQVDNISTLQSYFASIMKKYKQERKQEKKLEKKQKNKLEKQVNDTD